MKSLPPWHTSVALVQLAVHDGQLQSSRCFRYWMYCVTCRSRQHTKQPSAAVGQSESIIGGPPVVVPPPVVAPVVVPPPVVEPVVVPPLPVVPPPPHHCATWVAASVQLAHETHGMFCPPAWNSHCVAAAEAQNSYEPPPCGHAVVWHMSPLVPVVPPLVVDPPGMPHHACTSAIADWQSPHEVH